MNSLPAVCADCSYQVNAAATPVVLSATRSAEVLTIALSDPLTLNFPLSEVSVTYLGVSCISLAGSISSFTCNLPKNTDNSVALPAGSGKPKVHIVRIGFADNSALTAETVSLSVSSFSPAETSPGGGVQATVIGVGFPISSK